VILGLLLVSAAAAAYASSAEHAYSDAFPKRIMLQHLHLLGPDGAIQASAAFSSDILCFCDMWAVSPARLLTLTVLKPSQMISRLH
jgi:hypothetical protein